MNIHYRTDCADTERGKIKKQIEILEKRYRVEKQTYKKYELYKQIMELNILFDLLEKAQLADDMKVAIQLLLNNQKAAEHYFERLKDDEQKFFESLPIYHFWKK